MMVPMTSNGVAEAAVWSSDLVARRVLSWYVISAGRVVTVAELVRWLDELGAAPPGRASKVVSDKLRADVARGRLRRVGRGRYLGGWVPNTRWRRMQASAHEAISSARAAGSAQLRDGSPPTPVDLQANRARSALEEP